MRTIFNYLKVCLKEAKEGYEMIISWGALLVGLVLFFGRQLGFTAAVITDLWLSRIELVAFAYGIFMLGIWLPAKLLKEKDDRIAELEGNGSPLEILDGDTPLYLHGTSICSFQIRNRSQDKSAHDLKVEMVRNNEAERWPHLTLPLSFPFDPREPRSINPDGEITVALLELWAVKNVGSEPPSWEAQATLLTDMPGRLHGYHSAKNLTVNDEMSFPIRATASDFKSITKNITVRLIQNGNAVTIRQRVQNDRHLH